MKRVFTAAILVLASATVPLACHPQGAAVREMVPQPPRTAEPVRLPVLVEADASAATSAPGSASLCLRFDVGGGESAVLTGALVVDAAFEHPTRGKTRPYILRLDAPRCVVNDGHEEPAVVEIHLAPTDVASLKPLVGKRVRVSGEPFAATTASHARSVVFLTSRVEPEP